MTDNLLDQDKPKKTIVLDVGFETYLPVIINHDTGVLFSLTEDLAGDVDRQPQQKVKLTELLPSLDDLTLAIYVHCLRGKPIEVVDRPSLINCLAAYSLTEDLNFFHQLLQQLLKLWTLLSPVLYTNKVDFDVKWDIWLRCPYQLLPDDWLSNREFMAEWQELSSNKSVVINDIEVFNYADESTQLQIGYSPEPNAPPTVIDSDNTYYRFAVHPLEGDNDGGDKLSTDVNLVNRTGCW